MRSKTKTREPKTYEFTEAIATESLRPFVGAPIDKGAGLAGDSRTGKALPAQLSVPRSASRSRGGVTNA
jgi:hypothetical protein